MKDLIVRLARVAAQYARVTQIGIVVALGSVCFAQDPITIRDGNVSFTIRNYSGRNPTFGADLIVNGTDHMNTLPIYFGGGTQRGQRPLFTLTATTVSGDGTACRLTYRQTLFDSRQNFLFTITYFVDITIKDTTLWRGQLDSARLTTRVVAVPNTVTSSVLLRTYMINDPVVNGSAVNMRATSWGDKSEKQTVLGPAVDGRSAALTWTVGTDGMRGWEITDMSAIDTKLTGRDTYFPPNAEKDYGPGAYGGRFSSSRPPRGTTRRWLTRPSTSLFCPSWSS